ncbi:MAG: hypothetical protein JNK48_07120, partial [Bryobacterales bacterium]|nr:hypothetical protein [Bryobacterales bacterium]
MKYLLCQISFSALVLAQPTMEQARRLALCEAMEREYTYLADEAARDYVQQVAGRMGAARVRIVDEAAAWVDVLPCGLILVTKGFLQRAASEREVAERIAHMMGH